MAIRSLPEKEWFRIGEVAELVGVRPHVLRHWETEFAQLRPRKTRGAHRQYTRRDVQLALFLRELLHERGLTVAGRYSALTVVPMLPVNHSYSARAALSIWLSLKGK